MTRISSVQECILPRCLVQGLVLITLAILSVSARGHASIRKDRLPHPRLFFDPVDLTELRGHAQSTHAEIWQPIGSFVHSLPTDLPSDLSEQMIDENTFRNYGNMLIPVSFVCIVTAAPEDCERARNYLVAMSQWPSWDQGLQRDLGMAHMLLGTAVAYDWLFSYLTTEQRGLVQGALINWGQKMAEASTQPYRADWNNWWPRAYLQNHFWINHSALGMAALVLLGDRSEIAGTCRVMTPSNVNIRRGPGLEYPVELIMAAGKSVVIEAEGQVDDHGFTWWHLIDGNWVRADVVSHPDGCGQSDMSAVVQGWLDVAIDRISRGQAFLDGAGDGTWHEGISYQNYGMTFTVPFWINLRRLLGIDLIPHTYLQDYIQWRTYNLLPGRTDSILSFGDYDFSWGNTFASQNLLRFAAGEERSGLAEWTAQQLIAAGGREADIWLVPWYVFEFLYYDPTVASAPPDDLRLSRSFDDLEAVIWRTGWTNDDLVFALKSGAYGGRYAFDTFTNSVYPWEAPCLDTGCELNIGHEHDDTNTFYLFKSGHWLAPETVGNDLFQTSYHNTLLIDGQGQYRPPYEHYGQVSSDFVESDGQLVDSVGIADFDYVSSEVRNRYKQIPGIDSIRRHVLFVRPDYLIMLDVIQARGDHSIEWTAHLEHQPLIEGNWIRAQYEDGLTFGIAVVAPQAFKIVDGHDGRFFVRMRSVSPSQSVRLVNLLLPTTESAWDLIPAVELLDERENAIAIRVHWEHGEARTDDILFQTGPDTSLVQLGPYTFDGRVSVIRTASVGQIVKFFMYGGTFLSVENAASPVVTGLDAQKPYETSYQQAE